MIFNPVTVKSEPQKATLSVTNNTAETARLLCKTSAAESAIDSYSFPAGQTRVVTVNVGMWFLLIDCDVTDHSGCGVGPYRLYTDKYYSHFIYISEPEATLTFGEIPS